MKALTERRIETHIDIAAPIAEAWAVLTAFGRYREWNPLIREIAGTVEVGAPIRVRLSRPGGWGSMTIRPVVTVISKYELCWLGKVVSPRIFAGRHSFRLVEQDDRATRFIHAEDYHGILAPAVTGVFGRPIAASFRAMNRAFRSRVEYELRQGLGADGHQIG